MRRRPRPSIRSTTVVLACAVLLVAGPAACSSGDDTRSATTATTKAPGSSVTTATTKPRTASSSTAVAAGPTTGYPGPRPAIEHLVAAWKANDRPAALLGAVPAAVTSIFSQPGDGFEQYGCDSGEFASSNCNYRNRATGGYAQITAERSPIGWIVTGVTMTTDN